LQSIFERIDRCLVFDELFYKEAVNFLNINSFGEDYLRWCYNTFIIENKAIKNVRNYYRAILGKPEAVKLYQNDKETNKAASETEAMIICPACGKGYHMQAHKSCPSCGLPYEERNADEKIKYYKILYEMPETAREEMRKEEKRVFEIPNIQEKITAYSEVLKKYGLS
jgi:ribosomal protein L37E